MRGLFKGRKDEDLGLDDDRLGLGSDAGIDPFAPPSQAADDNYPISGIPPPASTIDFSNPDINRVSGSPRPREHEESPFMSPEPQEQARQGPGTGHVEKDLQIIIAKLDAVKSELDSLHQRVQRIERIAEADQDARMKKQQQPFPRW